jgi:hypothetical protein
MMTGIPAAITTLLLAAASSPGDGEWHRRLGAADGPLEALTVVVPFLEGLQIDRAAQARFHGKPLRLQLAYPGALSAPFVAWRFGDGPWQIAAVSALGTQPAELTVASDGAGVDLRLRSLAGDRIELSTATGNLTALAGAVRRGWRPQGSGRPLAAAFDGIDFLVHQFVAAEGEPALRQDWSLPALVAHLRQQSPRTIQFVYGFDPSGIDLGGRYFWSAGAVAKVKEALQANPRLSHLNWLNLRTWKQSIPRLGAAVTPDRNVRADARVLPGGLEPEKGQYQSRSFTMCLAARGWQQSRLRELDHLARLGFKVIQLDEFPIPFHWHSVACQARTHLHRPGDIADEWKQIGIFLRTLGARARARGLWLTSEEPSAALLPYLSGYIDRQFNAGIDLYRDFREAGVRPVPLFSLMFGDLATPYTDADGPDPARTPPPGWLVQHKRSPVPPPASNP